MPLSSLSIVGLIAASVVIVGVCSSQKVEGGGVCGQGKYDGPSGCVPCPQNTFGIAPPIGSGARSMSDACKPCLNDGSTMLTFAGKSICNCAKGYQNFNPATGGCSACAIGQSSDGKQGLCYDCPIDTFASRVTPGADDCISCQRRGTTDGDVAQLACKCIAGSAGSPSPNHSPAGDWDSGCTDCDFISYSNTIGMSTCKLCDPVSCLTTRQEGADRNQVKCKCKSGFGSFSLETGACQQCPANYFSKGGLLQETCTECAYGTWAAAGASECTPLNCAIGMFIDGSGHSCTACPAQCLLRA